MVGTCGSDCRCIPIETVVHHYSKVVRVPYLQHHNSVEFRTPSVALEGVIDPYENMNADREYDCTSLAQLFLGR